MLQRLHMDRPLVVGGRYIGSPSPEGEDIWGLRRRRVEYQQTLAFGSVEDVRQEVLENYRILGAGGDYILAPCHNIQVVSPPENVVAMYETGYEFGRC